MKDDDIGRIIDIGILCSIGVIFALVMAWIFFYWLKNYGWK